MWLTPSFIVLKPVASRPATFVPATDLVPQTIATVRKINNKEGGYFFKTLLNSGATPKLPPGVTPHNMPAIQVQTIQGKFLLPNVLLF
jgi:predicted phage gp36 major capsid-like protein